MICPQLSPPSDPSPPLSAAASPLVCLPFMVRYVQKPSSRVPRPTLDRSVSNHLLGSTRRPGHLGRARLARLLCWIAVVLPSLALLSYSRASLTRIRAGRVKETTAGVVGKIQCIKWRHTLSCSPYGFALPPKFLIL